MEFEIEGLPRMTNTSRVHWTRKMAEATRWKNKTINAVGEQGFDGQTLTKAKLTLTRFSSKPPDFDGLVSSFKHVIDGLVLAKVIIDDNVTVIGQPTYLWEKASPRKGKIKIKVEGDL